MPRVYYSTIISAPIEQVWEIVRDFNGLPKWHPGIKAGELEGDFDPDAIPVGAVRRLELPDGSSMREQLLAISEADCSFTYTMLDPEMKIKDYTASVTLSPIVATDETFAEWEAVFDMTDPAAEEETIDGMFGVFSSGLENLDEMLMEMFEDEEICEACEDCSCGDE